MLNKLTTAIFIGIGLVLVSMGLYVLAVLIGACAAFNHEGVLFN